MADVGPSPRSQVCPASARAQCVRSGRPAAAPASPLSQSGTLPRSPMCVCSHAHCAGPGTMERRGRGPGAVTLGMRGSCLLPARRQARALVRKCTRTGIDAADAGVIGIKNQSDTIGRTEEGDPHIAGPAAEKRQSCSSACAVLGFFRAAEDKKTAAPKPTKRFPAAIRERPEDGPSPPSTRLIRLVAVLEQECAFPPQGLRLGLTNTDVK